MGQPELRAAVPSSQPVRPTLALAEAMECRHLLSGTPAACLLPAALTHYTDRTVTATNAYAGSATPYGKSPTQVRSAYGLGAYGSNTVTFDGVEGDGTGQTIAIIDAYDYPSAAADLNAFSAHYGLPTLTANASLDTVNAAAGPTFTKVSQTGSTTRLPGTDPAGPYASTGASTWEIEAALDVEWAHVMAPRANLLLVECSSDADADLIAGGAAWAARQAGVVAVSMSFGGSEFASETDDDAAFTSAASHVGGAATAGGTGRAGGVTFLAAAGDDGAYAAKTTALSPQYPAASPDVIAVGGTRLDTTGSTYAGESAWGNGTASGTAGGGGGGVSVFEPQPAPQSALAAPFSTAARTYPDVSILADPDTGVPIYDSYDYGTATPWVPGYEGGTSLACPLTAGLVAVADGDRAVHGLGSLGTAAALANLYAAPAADYHDVTTGSNGYAAKAGYDLASGRGSPVAGRWVADVAAVTAAADTAATGTVAGRVFRDADANGTFDAAADAGLADVTVYLDANGDGTRQSTEPTATTDSAGRYAFAGVAAGATGSVRPLATPAGYVAVSDPTYTATADATATADLGLFPTAYADADGNDAYTVRGVRTAVPALQILINGTLAYTAPVGLAPSLSFTFTGSADALAVDLGGVDPVPAGGIAVDGSSAADGDTLAVLGNATSNAINVNAGAILADDQTITYANVPHLSVDPRSGLTALNVNANAVTVPAQTAGGGILARRFTSLAVAPAASLTFATAAAPADRSVLVLTNPAGPTVYGKFDLGGNDMIVRGGTVAGLTALVRSGYAGGAWTGAGGIASAAAAADPKHLTGLAVAPASFFAGPSTFDGQTADAADAVIKYTYYGDANLDGRVDLADYTRADAGFIAAGSTWVDGDFNYDAAVDGSDYTLLDAAYAGQSATL